MAKEAPVTVAVISVMKGLAVVVNLQIYLGFMFYSFMLKSPCPSCPNWLRPMLNMEPKVLSMRK